MTTARFGLLLTPGAGAGRDQPSLVAIEEAVTPHGVAVERMDFPYRLAGRRAPDKPAVLLAAVVEGAARLAAATGLPPERAALGGRSMGGRICSMAAAEGLACAGLVLVSYPLHPAGHSHPPEGFVSKNRSIATVSAHKGPPRADRPSRAEHFPRINVPCLFVSGTRDAFATPAELEKATALIPGEVTHVWLEGGDHGLRRRDADVAAAASDWLLAL
ncbi:MAG TPA: alpha/beta family hydrolase [Acidimicrobiales bacterium]|nr:alpha/beta family hydrolase [Acidimicrobiales bacterium]